MVDVDLTDPEAVPVRQHRDVAVELAVELDRFGDRTAHRLEPAVEVAAFHTADPRRDCVVDLGGVALDRPVLAHPSPAARDQVEPAVERVEERRDPRGVVLPVGVHEHDDVAPQVGEGGGQRVALADVAPQPDPPDVRVAGDEVCDDLPGVVGAPVVDDDDLVRQPLLREDRDELVDYWAEVLALVVRRQQDIDLA